MTPKLLLPRLAHACRKAPISRLYSTPAPPWTPARNRILGIDPRVVPVARHFGTTNKPPLLKAGSTNFPPRPKPPPDEEIEESFLKGSGPGGQKINKTNSAVQLKHLPTGLVVKCQATRSRSQNRKIARQLLADKLDDMARGDASRASVVGEVKRKKKASSAKKSRRKYRKLGEEGASAEEIVGEQPSDERNEITGHGDKVSSDDKAVLQKAIGG
ncbi:putative peptidyl-tRNA hydrolase domain protein [Rosellinia necatrix]|uniref:Putative peptidyl-tRNA hydrolase domain protein n=1 Tax=Rosellinia necatrix TaxID=77044 RepID=A0A1W2TLE5_ROSNE|nr:putative peptidyl-tRNA hydrolase domain protein [Rosellinia necatrix]